MTPHQSRRTSRLTLVLFLLVFLGPLAFAWNIARQADTLKFDTTNHGTLIQPPVNIKTIKFLKNDGALYPAELMLGRWWLVDVVLSDCETDCTNLNHMLNNVHIALGKNQGRVHRLTISQKPLTSIEVKGLHLFTEVQALKDQFKHHGIELNNRLAIVIIDPLGQMMMVYTPESSLKGVYADLKRLLSASTIG